MTNRAQRASGRASGGANRLRQVNIARDKMEATGPEDGFQRQASSPAESESVSGYAPMSRVPQ
jgi:hypothetical protein